MNNTTTLTSTASSNCLSSNIFLGISTALFVISEIMPFIPSQYKGIIQGIIYVLTNIKAPTAQEIKGISTLDNIIIKTVKK